MQDIVLLFSSLRNRALSMGLAVSKGLAVLHHHQVDVDVRDHLGHRAAVAIGGLDVEADLATDRQPLLR